MRTGMRKYLNLFVGLQISGVSWNRALSGREGNGELVSEELLEVSAKLPTGQVPLFVGLRSTAAVQCHGEQRPVLFG